MNARLISCLTLALPAVLLIDVSGQESKNVDDVKKINIKFVNPDGKDLGANVTVPIRLEWDGGHDAINCAGMKFTPYDFKGRYPEEFSIQVSGSASVERPPTTGLSGKAPQQIVLVYRPMISAQLTLKQINTLVTVRLASDSMYLRLHKSPTENEMEQRYREALRKTIAVTKTQLIPELDRRIRMVEHFEAAFSNVEIDKEGQIVVVDKKGGTKAVLVLNDYQPAIKAVSVDHKYRITAADKKAGPKAVVIDTSGGLEYLSHKIWEGEVDGPLKIRAKSTLEDKSFFQPLKDDLMKWRKALENMDDK